MGVTAREHNNNNNIQCRNYFLRCKIPWAGRGMIYPRGPHHQLAIFDILRLTLDTTHTQYTIHSL